MVQYLQRSDYAGVWVTEWYGIHCVSRCSNTLHTYRLVSVDTSTRIDIYLNIHTHTLSCQIFIFAHSHFYLEILGYYTCSTIVHPLFVEHFQGQQAELIGYALGFWPSPTELGRNWHSATHKKPYLPWRGPDKGIDSSNMHCIPRRKACFLELVGHCMWWAAWLTLAIQV